MITYNNNDKNLLCSDKRATTIILLSEACLDTFLSSVIASHNVQFKLTNAELGELKSMKHIGAALEKRLKILFSLRRSYVTNLDLLSIDTLVKKTLSPNSKQASIRKFINESLVKSNLFKDFSSVLNKLNIDCSTNAKCRILILNPEFIGANIVTHEEPQKGTTDSFLETDKGKALVTSTIESLPFLPTVDDTNSIYSADAEAVLRALFDNDHALSGMKMINALPSKTWTNNENNSNKYRIRHDVQVKAILAKANLALEHQQEKMSDPERSIDYSGEHDVFEELPKTDRLQELTTRNKAGSVQVTTCLSYDPMYTDSLFTREDFPFIQLLIFLSVKFHNRNHVNYRSLSVLDGTSAIILVKDLVSLGSEKDGEKVAALINRIAHAKLGMDIRSSYNANTELLKELGIDTDRDLGVRAFFEALFKIKNQKIVAIEITWNPKIAKYLFNQEYFPVLPRQFWQASYVIQQLYTNVRKQRNVISHRYDQNSRALSEICTIDIGTIDTDSTGEKSIASYVYESISSHECKYAVLLYKNKRKPRGYNIFNCTYIPTFTNRSGEVKRMIVDTHIFDFALGGAKFHVEIENKRKNKRSDRRPPKLEISIEFDAQLDYEMSITDLDRKDPQFSNQEPFFHNTLLKQHSEILSFPELQDGRSDNQANHVSENQVSEYYADSITQSWVERSVNNDLEIEKLPISEFSRKCYPIVILPRNSTTYIKCRNVVLHLSAYDTDSMLYDIVNTLHVISNRTKLSIENQIADFWQSKGIPYLNDETGRSLATHDDKNRLLAVFKAINFHVSDDHQFSNVGAMVNFLSHKNHARFRNAVLSDSSVDDAVAVYISLTK